MAPVISTFHVSDLPAQINTLPSGKQRNPPIKLEECPMKEMVQYRCNAQRPTGGRDPVVVCEPVVRFYRQCADNLMIETTAWEARREKSQVEGAKFSVS
ncbi:hypothetical protein K504DRAFT_128498 [Pleomassaria siparia CBS 279.74]|uniref:Mitochondrial export protein Som1 n=1 Tax=Pleomassaria siparia CBS 279.74 TaxID=1314801 RepID=A0A6G1KJS8_9PLEO|nr:hypothetical protein K504DRAFT_128498 [Pleomassaria siparia CBS 279.74]